jgi:hypothetical protein
MPLVRLRSNSPEVVVAVYGPQWYPAAEPLRVLTAGITLIGLTIGIGSIYYAKGRPVLDLYLHSVRLALIIAVVSATARYGLLPASIGTSAVEGTMAIIGQLMANSIIELPAWQLLRSLAPGIRNLILAVIATEIGRLIASATGLHAALPLAVIVVVPGLAIAVVEMRTLIAIANIALRRQNGPGARPDG